MPEVLMIFRQLYEISMRFAPLRILNRHFYNVVAAVFEQFVGFLNLLQGESVRYQRRCVDFSLRDKPQNRREFDRIF